MTATQAPTPGPLSQIPTAVVSDTMNVMARAYERIHSMPRVSDTELAIKVGEAKERLRPFLAPTAPVEAIGSEREYSDAEIEAAAQALVDHRWNGSQPDFSRKPPSWKAEHVAEVRAVLAALATTPARAEAQDEGALSVLDRLLNYSGARGSFDAMKHGDAVKDAEELLRSVKSPSHTDLMVTPESIDAYMKVNPMEAQDEGAAGDSAIALARRCTQTIAAQHGPDSDFANGARMVLAALICAPALRPCMTGSETTFL